jgi:alpha-L-fucosidase
MLPKRLAVTALLASALTSTLAAQQFDATWEALGKHTPPAWFSNTKFGIFIHWGVYSVPSFCDTSTYSEWYQHWLDTNSHGGLVRNFHERVYGKDFAYRQFAEQFRAELWNPEEWAKIFARAGAGYIVITSKHHDGFCLWPSAIASEARGYPWNAVQTGPKRDLLGELATAVRKEGIKFGTYYSFLEWHNPLFEKSIPDYAEKVMFPQVKELIERYHPDLFWPDGEWEHPDTTWSSPQLLQWLYANVPNPESFLVNDRWGKGLRGRTGDFFTTEYGDGGGGGDSYSGQRAFEECRGIGHSFAFNRAENYDVYLSRTEAVRTLIDMVSRGGNLLLDIGPAADGTIPLIMVDRLYAIGDWLKTNGEAIHGTTKSPFRSTPWGRATQKGETVYLHLYDWPKSGRLVVPLTNSAKGARVLGEGAVPVQQTEEGLVVDLRSAHGCEHATVVAIDLVGAPTEQMWFVPDGDGVITLPANCAKIDGKNLKLQAQVDRHASATVHALASWNTRGDAATWELVAPGKATRSYLVELELAVAPGSQGGTMVASFGTDSLEWTIPEATGGWQDYRRVVIGTVHRQSPQSLRIMARDIQGQGLCNLRAVRLVPDTRSAELNDGDTSARDTTLATLLRGMDASLKGGKPEEVAALYADDAALQLPGATSITGRAAIDAFWREHKATASFTMEVANTSGRGDLAVQQGRCTWVSGHGPNRWNTDVTDFVLTWRQQPDNSWRIVSHVAWPAR